MKALSLTQPMAWAIFHGKDVENRRWPTKVRGRIYLHASQGFDKRHYNFIALEGVNCLLDEPLPEKEEYVHGAIIGEVDIVDCEFYPADELARLHSPWAMSGQYQFVLDNAVEYENPIPWRGQLRLFNIPCSEAVPCCGRRDEYNGFSSGPLSFVCPHNCSCHD